MKKKLFICVLALILALSVAVSVFLSAPASVPVQNNIEAQKINTLDFSLKLLSECAKESENVLVSPLCAFGALSTAALGASGSTKTQLESVLGSGASAESIASAISPALSESDCALSLWVNNDGRLVLNENYAALVKGTLNAELSATDFSSALEKMNSWVVSATDGKISAIIDDIPPEAVMYILSALSFDGEWTVPYTIENISDGEFVSTDGTKSDAVFMHSTENIYLETELFRGFAKPYTNGSYFAAFLPNEGIEISDILDSLNSAAFGQIMSNAQSKNVSVYIPKFDAKSELSLCDAVVAMGAADAFSPKTADFSTIGSNMLYISDFMQKATLSVDELGTTGGAAAGIEVAIKGQPANALRFDRPFIYFIINNGNLLFAGVLEHI